MHHLPCTALILIFVAIAQAAHLADAEPSDADSLPGNWLCAAATINGKSLPDASVKKLKLTLTQTHYKTQRADEVLVDTTYSLDAAKEPKHIDIMATEGDDKGKPALGIYRLDDRNTLTICYTMPGQPRPTRFESAAGSNTYLITWKRAPSNQ